MRILSCVAYGYYDYRMAASYEYLSFVNVLRDMGHEVYHFDYKQAAEIDKKAMNDFFMMLIKHFHFDLVFIVTYQDEFEPDVLDEAQKRTITAAWNCDDDWRWENYSKEWISHYTYMITTYRFVYEANKKKYSNLLLSQWGCTEYDEGLNIKKDIDFSFVGLCYGERRKQIDFLRKNANLIAMGKGSDSIDLSFKNKIKKRIAKLFSIKMADEGNVLPDQSAVKNIWNRSRISFTPLESSLGHHLQIKGRVFDMGLSGTLMLCNKNEDLYEFYKPDKEFVEFSDLEDCAEKAKYYLKNEHKRKIIASAYYDKTKNNHLWRHRFDNLFREMHLL